MKSITVNNYWKPVWDKLQAEQLTKTGIDPSSWKAAGRATKANPNKEDGGWWTVNGESMVDSWIEWRNGSHPWVLWEPYPGQPAIELSLSPIWNDVPVVMHIDRVMVNPDGELVVLDIKTGSRTPSSDLQLAFYAAGIEEMFGVRPRYGAYWMGRSGVVNELIDLDHLPKDAIVDIVTKFDQARKQELFLPNFSHCVMCGFVEKCKWKTKGI